MTLGVLEGVSSEKWQTAAVEYEQGTVVHVWPNQKGHTEDMKDGDDCRCESRCKCNPDYDLTDDGLVIVVHSDSIPPLCLIEGRMVEVGR